MEVLKIGVVLFDIELSVGGGFQQALTDSLLMNTLQSPRRKFVFYTNIESTYRRLQQESLDARLIKKSNFLLLVDCIPFGMIRNRFKNILVKWDIIKTTESHFLNDKIDLLHFTTPHGLSLEIKKIPYTITVWDSCHRDQVEFPEVRVNGEFEYRDDLYSRSLPKAVAVLVDSEHSKKTLSARFGIDLDRIELMPFLPASRSEKHSRCVADSKYIFYPAQLWNHKNHIYILDALEILIHKEKLPLKVVFSGGDRNGNLKILMNYADSLNLSPYVEWKGFISDEELSKTLANAFALVMPTYFGPTNLPPLEAFEVGIPVLYSDIPGAYEFLGDAAIYLDLSSPSSLVKGILEIWNDEDRYNKMVVAGQKRLNQIRAFDRLGIWKKILNNFAIKNKLNSFKHRGTK